MVIGNITSSYQKAYNEKQEHFRHIEEIADMTQRICEAYEKHIYENVDRAMTEFLKDIRVNINLNIMTYLNGKPIENQQALVDAVQKIITEKMAL